MSFKIKNKSGSGCLALFGLPFFAAGMGLLIFVVILPFIRVQKSSSWQEIPCRITMSELKTSSDSEGNSYKPIIHYTYAFEGKTYESRQIDFASGGGSSDYSAENAFVSRFPLGSEQRCFVDPTNPSDAVLVRDWGRGIWKWVMIPFGGVFACVGFGIMVMGLYPYFKRKPKVADSGPVTLKPTGQRLGAILGLLFMNIFWNGIVSVFLFLWIGGLVKGTARGFFEKWGMGLFLTPFILIGCALFWGLLKEVKKFFAPVVVLTLDKLYWAPGSQQNIQWRFACDGIERFKLSLICTEKATYRRGTNSVTDEEEVARFLIQEEDYFNSIGSVSYTVPENLMPSFSAISNEIVWELEVTALATNGGNEVEDRYQIHLVTTEAV